MTTIQLWMICLALLLPLTGFGQYAVDWARAGAGLGTNRGNVVVTDSENNIYIGGTYGDSLLIGDQVLPPTGTQSFIAKYSPTGELLWAYQSPASSMAVDAENNLYITGFFNSTITLGDSVFTTQGSNDYFIASYDSDFNFRWGQAEGGPENDWGSDVEVDPQGYLYVTGRYGEGMEFQDTVFQQRAGQLFIAKYSLMGEFTWVKSYHNVRPGSSSGIFGDGFNGILDVGSDGNLAVAATYWDHSANNDQILVMKTDSAGVPLWDLEITSPDEGMRAADVFIDPLNHVLIYGSQSSALSVRGIPVTTGGLRPFLVKFSASGSALWGRAYSDNNDMSSLRAAYMNNQGESYLMADFSEVILGGIDLTDADEVIFKVDTAGNVIEAMGIAQQSERTDAFDLTLDQFDNLVVTGYFRRDYELGDTVLIPTPDPNDPFINSYDVFLTKYSHCDFDAIDFLEADTISVCPATSKQVQPYDGSACGFSYQWDHGPTTASIEAQTDSSQFYFLTITDSTGQQKRDSVYVSVLDFTPPDLPADQVVCQGESLTLDAGAGYQTYEWSTGATTASIDVTQGGDYWVTVSNADGCQATDTTTVTKEVCTTLPEFETGSLKIYPNPNDGRFNLLTSEPLEQLQLQIVDLAGRRHFEQAWKLLPVGEYSLDANLSEGMYVLIMQTKEGRSQMKLLVD
ncbi:MAG: T9SS type A sorting domain-containing protein [Cyclobacteriaceae bacterium]|nr:T9SS type A sorting domain-containing protein [Cyclobacteriaceae bacterium]